MSFSAVTCHGYSVKERCTKREKNKGRILTLSPQRVHEARERRRAEQTTPTFQQRYAMRAGIEGSLSEGIRSHGLRHARYRGPSKTQLQAQAIAAAINEGKHPSDAAADGSWTLASAQASSVSFCSFAVTLGGMMSGQNFPAESFIHPIATLHLTSLGLGVVQVGKRSFVDTHWDRGLSYLKIG